MRVGGVKLERGKIVNLILDSVPSAPAFDANDAGELTFSLADKLLRFNDGEKLIALNTTISEDPNLKTSLGSNWLNSDLSFNPVPFNALPGISGLAGTDSLFDVIDQMTTLIQNVATVYLSDIQAGPAPEMSVVAYLSGDLLLVDMETALEGSTISLGFDNLKGFDINDTTEGNMVVFNADADLVSKKANFTYENFVLATDHQIVHGLGVQHCVVYCINPQTNVSITPNSVTFTDTTKLIVHFDTAVPLKAFVINLEPVV